MPRWIKLATLVVGVGLLVLAFVLPWFRGTVDGETYRVYLNPLVVRGDSGLHALQCNPRACAGFPVGRAAGGAAWLASFFVHASIAMLAYSAYLVGRDRPIAGMALWSAGVSTGVLLLTALIWLAFEAPASVGASVGPWCALAGGVLGMVGQTRVFDALAPATIEPARGRATLVLAGDLGEAGLRLTTATGEVRIDWDELASVTLLGAPLVGLELTTRFGEVVYLAEVSRIDYRALPGSGGSFEDNLRRLHAFARQRNRRLA